MKILVTDSSERSSLSIIRSLGKAGFDVTSSDSTAFNCGSLSRYSRRHVVYPSPESKPEEFLGFMLEHLKNNEYNILIPPGDVTSMLFSRDKDDFSRHCIMAIPDYSKMIKAYDKALTIKFAANNKIPHPRTFFVKDMGDVKAIAKDIKYPAVIKPRSKSVWVNDGFKIMKITEKNFANNPEELAERYSRICTDDIASIGYFPMIQECIQGDEYGVEMLFEREPKAVFMHKRIRSYPITGGASTLRIGVRDDQMIGIGANILKALKWDGIAMVEFKKDSRDNKPKLIEINGRFWGSLPLAISSGVDFPKLLVEMIQKKGNKPVLEYDIGKKQRWLIPGDLLWLAASLKKQRWGAIMDFISSTGTKDDIIGMQDPLPAIGAIKTSLDYAADVMSRKRNVSGEKQS